MLSTWDEGALSLCGEVLFFYEKCFFEVAEWKKKRKTTTFLITSLLSHDYPSSTNSCWFEN